LQAAPALEYRFLHDSQQSLYGGFLEVAEEIIVGHLVPQLDVLAARPPPLAEYGILFREVEFFGLDFLDFEREFGFFSGIQLVPLHVLAPAEKILLLDAPALMAIEGVFPILGAGVQGIDEEPAMMAAQG